jgi:hypothetical protein
MDVHPCCCIRGPPSHPAHRTDPLTAAFAQTPQYLIRSFCLADREPKANPSTPPHRGTRPQRRVADRCDRTPGGPGDRKPTIRVCCLQQSLGL